MNGPDFTDLHRVQTDSGSHIEPSFDEGWDDYDKLRWKAAVTAVESGVQVSVSPGGYRVKRWGRWMEVPGFYSFSIGASAIGAFDFHSAWDFMNGVAMGADAARSVS